MNKASERIYKKGEIHENWKQFEKMEIFDSWTDCNDIGNVRILPVSASSMLSVTDEAQIRPIMMVRKSI